jgi:hypothetical protein
MLAHADNPFRARSAAAFSLKLISTPGSPPGMPVGDLLIGARAEGCWIILALPVFW